MAMTQDFFNSSIIYSQRSVTTALEEQLCMHDLVRLSEPLPSCTIHHNAIMPMTTKRILLQLQAEQIVCTYCSHRSKTNQLAQRIYVGHLNNIQVDNVQLAAT